MEKTEGRKLKMTPNLSNGLEGRGEGESRNLSNDWKKKFLEFEEWLLRKPHYFWKRVAKILLGTLL